MGFLPILSAVIDHISPSYEWHWPGELHIQLSAWNSWLEHTVGINPGITNQIVMLWFTALFVWLFFLPVARRYVTVPHGMRNFLEPVLLYIRDEMVYPWMSHKDGRRLLPYFWTLFFFIVTANLIGLLPYPFGVTATGNWNVTGALAIVTLLVGIGAGMAKKGAGGYWLGLVPHGVDKWLVPFILVLEVIGLVARHVALMIRLFANMTAGHAILAVLALWLTINPAFLPIRAVQAVGAVAMICFEIFIALVQAYIFTILSAIYIGLSLAEEH